MNNYQHLLSKHGILVSFNIAKKIKQSQILAIRRRLEKKNINPKKIEKEIDKEIKSRTQKYLNQTDIPGLVTSDSYGGKIVIDPKIQRKILTLANKAVAVCKLNKFSKEHVIFFIQAVFHLLKITNDDVTRFKEKYNISHDPSDDYLDEEEDDGEDNGEDLEF
jgi:hypothetical protein